MTFWTTYFAILAALFTANVIRGVVKRILRASGFQVADQSVVVVNGKVQ